ncbi:hypothetical protein GCM10009797_29740 [Nocardioides hwasunensis]
MVVTLAATAQVGFAAERAAAAVTYVVTTTADSGAGAGACGNSSTTAPAAVTLREATCLANNAASSGNPVTVTVPAGTYTLANGELALGRRSGQAITLAGSGSASTIIDADGVSRVLSIDPDVVGGVSVTLSGLTVRSGTDAVDGFGGAGIIAGSGNATTLDDLTLDDVRVTANQAGANGATSADRPGGGLQFIGGRLTVRNSTFASNQTRSSDGSAILYAAQGATSGESLTITGSRFDQNTTSNSRSGASSLSGGALAVRGPATASVSGSVFTSNTAAQLASGPAAGGAILARGGTLDVQRSVFRDNRVTSSSAGGAVHVTSTVTSATVRFNRFVGNSSDGGAGAFAVSSAASTLTDNWFGCNAGPNGGSGCDTTSGGTPTPYLQLRATASPATVSGPNATSTIAARLTPDSAGNAIAPADLAAFSGAPVVFSDPTGDATVGGSAGNKTVTISGGEASTSYQSGTVTGTSQVEASLDNATSTATVTVNQPPAITTNPSDLTVAPGATATFTAAATGAPTPTVQWQRSTDGGTTFTSISGATSTAYSFTAATGDDNHRYRAVFTSSAGTATTTAALLRVRTAPAITSASSTTFARGSAGSFQVTASGSPAATFIATGTLPAGVSLTSAGLLSGTPTQSGVFPFEITATNGVNPDATQEFTLTVTAPPAVTSNPGDQVAAPGATVTFTAAASGVPGPTVQWQRSIDGATFANVAGATSPSYAFTASLGDNGNLYRAVFTNTRGTATTTAARLSVRSAPAFTSSDSVTFVAGTAGSHTITTSGQPAATVTTTSTLPAWLTLTPGSGGTATLSGTPPLGSGGVSTITLRASNGVNPDATQTLTLRIDEAPSVVSGPDDLTVVAGDTATLSVQARGYPAPSYQWQRDTGSGFAPVAGATEASYAVTARAGDDGARYRVTLTNSVGQSVSRVAILTVNAPPTFTSAATTTFTRLDASTFQVRATGKPAPTFTTTGPLPSGVALAPNGVLSGTPTEDGAFAFTIVATNGIGADATQQFTLRVESSPRLTAQPEDQTVEPGDTASFTATAAGFPAPSVQWQRSTGGAFTDIQGATSATYSLTAAAADNGSSYRAVFDNGSGATATSRAARLRVGAAPTFTSAAGTRFVLGDDDWFTVRASGPPTPSLALVGTLPDGVTFVDNADGTATLSGTARESGPYALRIVADNGFGTREQVFTLQVDAPPTITNRDAATFTALTAGSFTFTATRGHPAPTAWTVAGALPGGVRFTDGGDGSATLSGTPAAGTTGTYTLTVSASSGGSAPAARQTFTLSVVKAQQTITVTSATPVGAAVGGTYQPRATSDSGLEVAISIDPASTACSLSSGTVRFDRAGTCVVGFGQDGDADHRAAPQVQQSFVVAAAATATTVSTAPSPSVHGQEITGSARISSTFGAPAGTVQFSLDGAPFGAPIVVVDGTASAGVLTGPSGATLPAGAHELSAVFTPADAKAQAPSSGTTTHVVDRAATTTRLDVRADRLVATVATAPPARGVATGDVLFAVGGHPIGSASLVDGVATLAQTVPTGRAQQVSASYAGDGNHTGSSASTSRLDPVITAAVTSKKPRSRSGWYRTPVTITFTCTPKGAPLAEPCPAPVRLTGNGAGRSVTRTVSATDGGVATVVVSGIDIDRVRPTVRIAGVRDGATYAGGVPRARCVARDRVSGIASCRITTRKRGDRVVVTATAVDEAGNRRRTSVSVRTLSVYLEAPSSNGAYDVELGRTYTLVVAGSSVRPVYYDAEIAPRRPHRRSLALRPAGPGRWTIGVTMDRGLSGHRLWNLGVKVGPTMRLVKVRVS